MSRLVQQRRNRQTGTEVDVFDRGSDDDGGGRWETICVDHGAVCSHETRALAVSFAASPTDWCEDCGREFAFEERQKGYRAMYARDRERRASL